MIGDAEDAEWCGECQRYRVGCVHSSERARADGGAVDAAKASGPDVSSMDWEQRADELEASTSLKRREAEVQALKEHGLTHEQIGDELGIATSTVDEYSRRINARIEDAVGTVRELGVEDV